MTQALLLLETRGVDDGEVEVADELVLDWQYRQKSRQRVTLASGREAAVMLPRGQGALRDGEILRAADGTAVRVRAAPEAVSTVHCDDPRQLARVAYHLGNRHVPLQVAANWVRYRADYVLDEMVTGLGLVVTAQTQPFEPESGAYGGGHHAHHDDDDARAAHANILALR